jgi:prolyl oligopeptidase
VLTIVGEKDTATVPMHGYKFTAALQAAQGCGRPSLLKFIPGAGHYSYGPSSAEAAETEAEILAFLIRALNLETG